MEDNLSTYVCISFDDCGTPETLGRQEQQVRDGGNAASSVSELDGNNEVAGTTCPAAAVMSVSPPPITQHSDVNPASMSAATNLNSNRKRCDEIEDSKLAIEKRKNLAVSCPAPQTSNSANSDDDDDDGKDDVETSLLAKNDKRNYTVDRVDLPLSSVGDQSSPPPVYVPTNNETNVGHFCRRQLLQQDLPVADATNQSTMKKSAQGVSSAAVAHRRRKYGLMRSYSTVIDSIRGGSGVRRRPVSGTRRRTFAHIYPPASVDHLESATGGSSCGEASGIEDNLAPVPSLTTVSFGHGNSPVRRVRGRNDFNSIGSPESGRARYKSDGVSSPPLFPVIGGTRDVDDNASTAGYLREQFSALFQVSDNRLAMKLFGSRNALQKEKQRQKESGNFVIHPCSSFR